MGLGVTEPDFHQKLSFFGTGALFAQNDAKWGFFQHFCNFIKIRSLVFFIFCSKLELYRGQLLAYMVTCRKLSFFGTGPKNAQKRGFLGPEITFLLFSPKPFDRFGSNFQ